MICIYKNYSDDLGKDLEINESRYAKSRGWYNPNFQIYIIHSNYFMPFLEWQSTISQAIEHTYSPNEALEVSNFNFLQKNTISWK